jgi:membrane-associated phospholipid phosphatase
MTPDLLIRIVADIAVIPVVLLGAYALLFKVPRGHRFEAYCRVLMAGLTAYLLAKFIATVYQPSTLRPFEILGVEAGASYLNNPGFPSDHALFVTAIFLAVWFETRNKLLSGLIALCVVLVALGRVLALVHTPLDVIGGIVIALIGALWYIQKPKPVEKRGVNGKGRR